MRRLDDLADVGVAVGEVFAPGLGKGEVELGGMHVVARLVVVVRDELVCAESVGVASAVAVSEVLFEAPRQGASGGKVLMDCGAHLGDTCAVGVGDGCGDTEGGGGVGDLAPGEAWHVVGGCWSGGLLGGH